MNAQTIDIIDEKLPPSYRFLESPVTEVALAWHRTKLLPHRQIDSVQQE